jgi:aminoglycoside phosphotransferase (APT) family kinase protein
VDVLTWLSERSVDALRTALDATDPDLAPRSITLQPWIEQTNPLWFGASAIVDDGFVAKFAWSQPAAERLWHEAQVLEALGGQARELRLPQAVVLSHDPVLLVTRLVPGRPLTYDLVGTSGGDGVQQIATELASFLAALHRPDVLTRVRRAVGSRSALDPQATTEALRNRFGRWIRPDQREAVMGWCDWADTTLSSPVGDVFVHGDFHGHNHVWEEDRYRLRLVVDLEHSGGAEPEYDFRYLPAQGPDVSLLRATMWQYESLTGRPLDIDRVMAWHIRTALGDALWRSEANVPLPGAGSPPEWVDELTARLGALCVGPL